MFPCRKVLPALERVARGVLLDQSELQNHTERIPLHGKLALGAVGSVGLQLYKNDWIHWGQHCFFTNSLLPSFLLLSSFPFSPFLLPLLFKVNIF